MSEIHAYKMYKCQKSEEMYICQKISVYYTLLCMIYACQEINACQECIHFRNICISEVYSGPNSGGTLDNVRLEKVFIPTKIWKSLKTSGCYIKRTQKKLKLV